MVRKERPLHRSDAASLKATVKATPVDADGQGNTNELIRLAPRIQNNPGWTSVDVLHRKLVELQNRWSASLAMSTDGLFPSRPRHLNCHENLLRYPKEFGYLLRSNRT
jgi:hypothetical protein